jgi:hypothetical protein
MRKLLAIFLGLAILGAAAYFYLNSGDAEPADDGPGLGQGMTQVTQESAISPAGSHDNDAVWFGLSDGRMMWLDLNTGNVSEYTLPPVVGNSFRRIYWPAQGSDFISMGLVGDQAVYNYYNYAERKYHILPSNVLSLDWLNDSRRVVLVWKGNDGKISLVVSNADATGYRVVAELPWADLVPKASPTDNVALMYKSSAAEVSKIYLFDLDTGKYTEAVSEGKNTGAVWSPQGGSFAYTQVAGSETRVHMRYLLGAEDHDLGLVATIDKVAFSADGLHLYAAARNDSGGEDIRRVDLATTDQKTVYSLPSGQTAQNLVVIGQKIFFTSGSDGKLYSIQP